MQLKGPTSNTFNYKNYIPIVIVILFVGVLCFLWRPLNIQKVSYIPLSQQAQTTVPTKDEFDSNSSVVINLIEKTPATGTDEPIETVAVDNSLLPVPDTAAVVDDKGGLDSSFDEVFDEYGDVETIDAGFETDKNQIEYTIAQGDSLIKILTQYGVTRSDVYLLTQQFKKLANIRAGQDVSFVLDKDSNLIRFEWIASKSSVYIYEREGDKFTETLKESKGEWKEVIISGQVNTNFSTDGRKSGLTGKEIEAIRKSLQWQVDFGRLQKGAKFVAIFSREMLDDEHQKSLLLGVRLKNGSNDSYAFLADNGSYYDEKGAGLSRGFREVPLEKKARISSHFNPRRLHPITRRVSPHNGTDYAVSRGTPILAPGDGEVIVAKYSPSAGNYITIKHSPEYTTRYMHLDKLMVKQGQRVKKDQVIGKSGNTGRSTGPHLHYELYINGKAVNSLTAKLPKSLGLTGKERTAFLKKVNELKDRLKF